MTPLSFEWKWATDYFIFMGLLYLALLIIGGGLVYTYIKTWFDCDQGEEIPPKIPSRSKYTKY
ncbi:MAG: hypothetical protein JRC68_07735 [Deltaproteobacteria bacterium]|nr:hypothetical protein [Deltaproteobacteria bacterium]